MPIPRLIQQLWIGDQSKRPSALMQTWMDMNPSCDYIMWTEENLRGIKFQNQAKIDAMPELNGKCDIMRYELLYKFGGVFMDADTKCVATLDDFFFDTVERFTCWENEEVGKDPETGVRLLASGHQGCRQNDPFYMVCIQELSMVDVTTGRAWQVCGNRFLRSMADKHQESLPMTVYPSHYFIPKHGTGVEYKGSGKIYAEHYWGTTHNLYGKI
jgi:mannosyltransferase OCH1-like enzyme